ncbi:MAG: hypothetical protein M3Y71_05755 [Actinomycetota bacterium]|nr:hypothetical protein [Actinomycetota bacterium]
MTSLPETTAAGPSMEDLLQFLYLMPVGVVQCDEDGQVELVNPAAARLLAPAMAGTDLSALHPILATLCPDLLRALTEGGRPLGPVGSTQRFLGVTSAEHDLYVELLAVRVEVGRIMVVLLDVTLERQLVEHERAQMTDLDAAVVQDLVAAETALGLGDVDRARRHVSRSADAGRAWLARQLELLSREPAHSLDLVRADQDDQDQHDQDDQHRGRPR